MSIRRITFNWEFNVGTILMLTAQIVSTVAFTAVLYYRFVALEKKTGKIETTVSEHGAKMVEIDRKVEVVRTLVDERTTRRIP